MKNKYKKNSVARARLLTYVCIIPAFALFYLLFDYLKIMVENPLEAGSSLDTFNHIERYIFSIFVTLMIYFLGMLYVWNPLKRRKEKYKVIRFLYHYNKCVEAFGNMDLQKVKTIYNNRLKDVKVENVALQPLKDRIKFGYNIMSCKSNNEFLTPAKRYEE